ncbi:squalene/phytoene synthase family protein [Nocardia sp. NPDC050408]|uniref:squalene/phytoene synthase family protein n=1 Tax=Nocardia sp. NPDC050408 TaxID=3364319 RepID=UPI0037BC8CC2
MEIPEQDACTISGAYTLCAKITRQQARNFYYGMILLPKRQRLAMYALYALCHHIDDIADSDIDRDEKISAMTTVRRELENPERSDDPIMIAVADASHRFDLPLDALDDLIAGAQMDIDGAEFSTFDDTVDYCRHVAGFGVRLYLGVTNSKNSDPRLYRYGDQLAVAIQQTNILRDVREDLIRGRIYLPRDELARSGIRLEIGADQMLADPDGRLAAYLRQSAGRAEDWYCLGERLLPLLDNTSRACMEAMVSIYRNINQRIAMNPVTVYDSRISVPTVRKILIATKASRALVTRHG